MFKNAIVRTPGPTLSEGIRTASTEEPEYQAALVQHAAYIEALQSCGVEVTVMEADPEYPDSCFVEDTAVLAGRVAVITHPGAPARQGEEKKVEEVIRRFYPAERIEHITPPGTLEGGDVLRVKDHFYVGLSARTNEAGARQLIRHLEQYGYSGSTVQLKEMLHLKTGLAYLENNLLLTAGEFIRHPEFSSFTRIEIAAQDAYAANCIWVNGTVLIPAGYPATKTKIQAAGLVVMEVDATEFKKLDGGLSCLSLRF
jgi:dimethylargininase